MVTFYAEGILWYLILLDAIVYNVLCYSSRFKKTTHWISRWFPMNKFLGIWYLVLVLWIGFTLFRMEIILFK